VRDNAVMGEQGIQEGAEHAPLWAPCVEDQRSVGVVSCLHHLGAACQNLLGRYANCGGSRVSGKVEVI
jgi:hypothetical protein